MARVYVETSFFSACVSTRSGEKVVGWRASSHEWWRKEAPRHELFISSEVIRELSAPDFPDRDQALQMASGVRLLELTAAVEHLAGLMVKEKLLPAPAVAAAVVHRRDYILTWNVKHLANPNKRVHWGGICLRLGVVPPQIVTPDMLQEADNASG